VISGSKKTHRPQWSSKHRISIVALLDWLYPSNALKRTVIKCMKYNEIFHYGTFLITLYTVEPQFKVSRSKVFSHFVLIFWGPSKSLIYVMHNLPWFSVSRFSVLLAFRKLKSGPFHSAISDVFYFPYAFRGFKVYDYLCLIVYLVFAVVE
jgi:hypothetical protein